MENKYLSIINDIKKINSNFLVSDLDNLYALTLSSGQNKMIYIVWIWKELKYPRIEIQYKDPNYNGEFDYYIFSEQYPGDGNPNYKDELKVLSNLLRSTVLRTEFSLFGIVYKKSYQFVNYDNYIDEWYPSKLFLILSIFLFPFVEKSTFEFDKYVSN